MPRVVTDTDFVGCPTNNFARWADNRMSGLKVNIWSLFHAYFLYIKKDLNKSLFIWSSHHLCNILLFFMPDMRYPVSHISGKLSGIRPNIRYNQNKTGSVHDIIFGWSVLVFMKLLDQLSYFLENIGNGDENRSCSFDREKCNNLSRINANIKGKRGGKMGIFSLYFRENIISEKNVWLRFRF